MSNISDNLRKAQRFCVYSERCIQDVDLKLMQLKVSHQDRKSIIESLISSNFIDEKRYAISFVQGKFSIKKWGRIKIRSALKNKRISDQHISNALDLIETERYAKALKSLMEKKFSILRKASATDQQNKVYRYLLSKGYEHDLIQKALQSIIQS